MGLDWSYIHGQTPLDEEEKEGLKILTIATRGELDEFEQQNIEQAVQWVLVRSFRPDVVFTEKFICALHRRMYAEVWNWAGKFRKTNKNIGADKWQISTQLKCLLDDALFWHAHQTYPPDELALRFKHRLVSIHCFPNGNGRHSRLMADLIIEKLYRRPVFSWGVTDLVQGGDARNAYIEAVRAADRGAMGPLLTFARS
jgi:Fic-DOC domain mobile mystery protein B